MQLLHYLTSFSIALGISLLSLPIVIAVARRLGAVDRPGGRRSHRGDVPRLGGAGIFLGFVAGVGISLLLSGRSDGAFVRETYSWYGVAAGILLIFVAGTIDDLFDLRPAVKLGLQILAALIAVRSGFVVQSVSVPGLDGVSLGLLAIPATVAWIVLVTNAMNLVDGLDGLAGGLALIIVTTVAAVALSMNRFGVVICALALAGSLIGFLWFNFAPARIFMGDGGSQFLGYVISVIAIRGSQKGATAVAILVPLMALGLPILDVATTIVRRLASPGGTDLRALAVLRRLSRPDEGHIHHNLLAIGLSPRRAVLVLYAIGGLFALSGYISVAFNSLALAALLFLLSIGAVGLIKFIIADSRAVVPPKTVPGSGGG